METNFTTGDLVHARGREWVVLSAPRVGVLKLRPLYGSEIDTVTLHRSLEDPPVRSARFDLPDNAATTVQSKAALLADAMRLTLRRGAGPFRSAAQLAFEPRTYQLVPLLMALRLQVPRLLIADDVGIGKTIEAGLILRELMDRGEIDAFSVLCPPHLVEQWEIELKSRFGIESVAVTSGSAARLERNLPPNQTLFNAYPNTVVSLDYIKAEKRLDSFARTCPDFVVVDEAHACVGTHRGKQQRFNLLKRLAEKKTRGLVMLTATPHSGDEDAFARLLSLIDPSFGEVNFGDEKYRRDLARHFVQRRRIDLTLGDWEENRAFPNHETKERSYQLSHEHLDFQKSVLDYCFGVVEKVDRKDMRERRLAFWSTLALMRCVGSSPAAARRALRNRASGEGERLEPQIYDDDGDDEDAVDMEPGSSFPDSELRALIRCAEGLIKKPDRKLSTLIDDLKPLIKEGANPVVFCRYIATAEHVRDGLREAFPNLRVESVTGELTPDQRRESVEDMASAEDGEKDKNGIQRILVATDCLSEGINLQHFFDTVVHYDLSWNPVRHQQREGRVDRFGQPARLVRSIMMFSPDSAIDGAVLDVILRKAEGIRKATGVTVPLPDERGPVTDALIASMMLRKGSDREQMALDLQLSDGTKVMETRWRDASENEKRSRARFAQHAMKPQEVAPEWEKARSLLGSPVSFVKQAMSRFGAPLERQQSVLLAHVSALDKPLKQRLLEKDVKNTVRLVIEDPVPTGAALLTRTHPLTATLAEALVEASLDSESLPGLGIGRVGAWRTNCVQKKTLIALLRIRYKLTTHARKENLILAEEAALVGMEGNKIIATGEEARKLLNTPATKDLADIAHKRFITEARNDLPTMLNGPLAEFVQVRAAELGHDHSRLRAASKDAPRVTVKAVEPPDVIGLFVLLQDQDYGACTN